MSSKGTKKKAQTSSATFFAIAITGALAGYLFWEYGAAVADGLGYALERQMREIEPDFVAQDPRKATQIPNFVLPDRFGRKVSLDQFDAVDLLLVNIWSSGCPVCRDEVPALHELDRRLASIGKAALLTIAVDEKWEDVSPFFPQGTDLRILFDPKDEVAKGMFGTSKYPETFVLDKKRRIVARFDGSRPWPSDTMLDYLKTFI